MSGIIGSCYGPTIFEMILIFIITILGIYMVYEKTAENFGILLIILTVGYNVFRRMGGS